MSESSTTIALSLSLIVCFSPLCAAADEGTSAPSAVIQDATPKEQPQPEPSPALPKQLAEILKQTSVMNPEETLFLDARRKRVLLRTEVACEDCMLEMLCCLEQTKEHESILSFRGQAKFVHAALEFLGAKPGTPVTFTPEFKPPTGRKLDIFVNWVDNDGHLKRADARTWMRYSVNRYYSEKLDKPPKGVKIPHLELRYDPYNKEILWFGPMSTDQRDELLSLCRETEYQKAIRSFYKDSQAKPMTSEFVFSGSYHVKRDEDSTIGDYAAEGGFLICVANFAQATIDIREASSASDGGQAFEGWKGRVPAQGTPVILEIIPAPKPSQPAAETTQK